MFYLVCDKDLIKILIGNVYCLYAFAVAEFNLHIALRKNIFPLFYRLENVSQLLM